MNLHQTPEEIIKNASAQERILWNYIFLRFGTKIGLSQFYFAGPIAGSEVSIYNARKLYFALSIYVSGSAAAAFSNVGKVCTFFDENNVINSHSNLSSAIYNTVAAQGETSINSYEVRNMLFSRVTVSSYTYLRVLGYRLSI